MASFTSKAVDAEKAAFFESYCDAYEKITAAKTPDGQTKTEEFVQHLENRAEKLYKVILGDGLITKQLIADISNSLKNVRANWEAHKEEYDTLEKMVSAEVAKRGPKECFKDKKSAVMALLWSFRSLNFHCTFIEHLLLPDNLSPKDACKQTYQKVLAMYHGWVVSGTFNRALGWVCPSEEKLMKSFGFANKADLRPGLERFVAAARPVLNQIISYLDKEGVNFPDKV